MASLFLKFYESVRPSIGQISVRCLTRGIVLNNTETSEEAGENSESKSNKDFIHPSKDRRKPIPVETSLKYLDSAAYKETYGDDPVWKPYRLNFKGAFQPYKTRKVCIRQGIISTGNPCPICRDEYLVLDHRNVKLLNQFISEHNGEVIDFRKTGLCQRQHQNLLIAIHRAKDRGTIRFDVPVRIYDYSEWYKPHDTTQST